MKNCQNGGSFTSDYPVVVLLDVGVGEGEAIIWENLKDHGHA